MIIKIKDKEYSVDGYVNPINSMQEFAEKCYQQGREDVLREHREQCQGKCFKCEVSVPFVNSDGEEVILPYSYSYKTDCEDNRYINAKEVLSLIKQSRADAIKELKKCLFVSSPKEVMGIMLVPMSITLDDYNRLLKIKNE